MPIEIEIRLNLNQDQDLLFSQKCIPNRKDFVEDIIASQKDNRRSEELRMAPLQINNDNTKPKLSELKRLEDPSHSPPAVIRKSSTTKFNEETSIEKQKKLTKIIDEDQSTEKI